MSNPKEPSKDHIEPLPDDQLDDVHGGAVRVNKARNMPAFQAFGNDSIDAGRNNDTLFTGPSGDELSLSSKKKR